MSQGDTGLLAQVERLLDDEHKQDAFALAREAVNQTPDKAEAYVALGRCFEDAEQYEEAEAAYRKALDIAPQDEDVLRAVADFQWNADEYEASLSTCEKILKLNDKNAWAHAGVGMVLSKLGRYKRASRRWNRPYCLIRTMPSPMLG